MALEPYRIKIDGNEFVIRPNTLIQSYVDGFPPRISTSSQRDFYDSAFMEHEGMVSFMGGMGQKRFNDKDMFFDAKGFETGKEDDASLAVSGALWKTVAQLGITVGDMANDSASIYASCEYNGKLYFGVAEADWGTGLGGGDTHAGRSRLYSIDSAGTLVDLSATQFAATLTAAVIPADTTFNFTGAGDCHVGDYLMCCAANYSGWELVQVATLVDATHVTVTRAQQYEWQPGKFMATTAIDLPAYSMLYRLLNNRVPIKGGGGVTSLCTYDNRLYVGTQHGFTYMYDASTGYWYLQPYTPSAGSPYTRLLPGNPGADSVDLQMQAMCVFRDKLYAAVGNELHALDSATASGSNPWGSGVLQKIKDAFNINNIVVFNYALYMTSWQDYGHQAGIYKYDVTALYPVYKFDSITEAHSMTVYRGKLYIGTGKYNSARTKGVGQLWSFDGVTMRKIMSNPYNDEGVAGNDYTIFKLRVINDKLYFSDNHDSGLFVYDAGEDAYHRAHLANLNGLVSGMWEFNDKTYFTIQSSGVYYLGAAYDIGGQYAYGAWTYPYIQTSMFGANFPNIEKLYHRITLWHAPAVAGQIIHLRLSRNGMQSYSADHAIALVAGTTCTVYEFLEEGTSAATGGFSGVATGSLGIKATDLSLVIGLKSATVATPFTLHGFVVDYMPLASIKQRLIMQLVCVDRLRLPDGTFETKTGMEKAIELRTTFEEGRPILVESPLDAKSTTRTMMVSSAKHVVPDPNFDYGLDASTYYNIDGLMMVELTET